VNKHGKKFASSHGNWSTYENFAAMYDHIYKEMHAAGLTEKDKFPVLLTRVG